MCHLSSSPVGQRFFKMQNYMTVNILVNILKSSLAFFEYLHEWHLQLLELNTLICSSIVTTYVLGHKGWRKAAVVKLP